MVRPFERPHGRLRRRPQVLSPSRNHHERENSSEHPETCRRTILDPLSSTGFSLGRTYFIVVNLTAPGGHRLARRFSARPAPAPLLRARRAVAQSIGECSRQQGTWNYGRRIDLATDGIQQEYASGAD